MVDDRSPNSTEPPEVWSGMRLAKLPALAALVVLAVSTVLTDRVASLQWMWWTPRVFLATGALLWVVACLAIVRFWTRDLDEAKRLRVWCAVAVVATAVSFLSEWGFPRSRPEGAFRLVHWNASALHADFAPEAVRQLRELDPDAFIFTDTSPGLMQQCVEEFFPRGFAAQTAGKFVICSRVPVSQACAVVASRERFLSRFRLETALGTLDVEAIDLPSSTTLPRYHVLRSLGAEAAEIRAKEAFALPDVMCGDFNVPRGSASLDFLMPDATEAFRACGAGWGAGFPRDWAFLAIDLTLVREPWQPLRSQIVDFGVGRHRVQVVDLGRATPDGGS